jgi:hypothetical protein
VIIPEGVGSRVQLETRWQGAGGVGAFFERLSRRVCCAGCTSMSCSG